MINNEIYWIDKDNNRYDYNPEIIEEIENHTVSGNIFGCKENVICHQVNMYKVMGSGIAKQIKNIFPDVYEHYLKHNGTIGESDFVLVKDECNIKYIVNMYSQDNYGYDGKQYTNYTAMKKCFEDINLHIRESNKCGNNFSLAIPYKIGCGLGGGDWDIVSEIIVEELTDIDYTIYKLEK